MKSLLILPFLAHPLLHAAEPTVTLAGIQVVFDDGEKDFDGFKTSDPVKMEADGKIKVEGELPVTMATGKEETRSTPFEAKVGTAVTFLGGDKDLPTLKVKSVGMSDYDDDVFEIEFSTNRRLNDYAGFKFYTKDGMPVKADRGGSSWMGGFLGSKGSGDVSYRFKAMPSDLILAVETWTGREQITIKVDLSAGLAMPKP